MEAGWGTTSRIFLKYFFTHLWVCWIFIAAHGLFPGVASGRNPLALGHRLLLAVASPVAEHRLYDAQASVASALLSSARADRVRVGWHVDALARRWDLRSNSCADFHALLFSTR